MPERCDFTSILPKVGPAFDLFELRVPRTQTWGSSVSINGVDGPSPQEEGRVRVAIEMQSGDLIEIVARSIEMPLSVRKPGQFGQ